MCKSSKFEGKSCKIFFSIKVLESNDFLVKRLRFFQGEKKPECNILYIISSAEYPAAR